MLRELSNVQFLDEGHFQVLHRRDSFKFGTMVAQQEAGSVSLMQHFLPSSANQSTETQCWP